MMYWLILPFWLLLLVLVVLNHVSHHLVAISLLTMRSVESKSLDFSLCFMLQSMLVLFFPPLFHPSSVKKLNVSIVKIVSSSPSWFQLFWCSLQFWHFYLENRTTSQTSHPEIFSFHSAKQHGPDFAENANQMNPKNISWIMLLMQAMILVLYKISRLELKIYWDILRSKDPWFYTNGLDFTFLMGPLWARSIVCLSNYRHVLAIAIFLGIVWYARISMDNFCNSNERMARWRCIQNETWPNSNLESYYDFAFLTSFLKGKK